MIPHIQGYFFLIESEQKEQMDNPYMKLIDKKWESEYTQMPGFLTGSLDSDSGAW